MSDLSLPAIFIAGVLSFLSPCVLPLVPPYLTYLAGLLLVGPLVSDRFLQLFSPWPDMKTLFGGARDYWLFIRRA